MEFTVKYAKPSGEVVTSVVVGQNPDEVRHRLQEQGFLPIAVRSRNWSFSLRRKRRQTIKPEDFILAMVEFLDRDEHSVHYLRRPFQREPDFGVTSVNYNFADLLGRAGDPA